MKCIKITQPLHLFWIRSNMDIWYFNKLVKLTKKYELRWFNFYGNLFHSIAYPTWSSNIHASVFTCLTLFWNGFYADISKDTSCNRQSPYLYTLDFWSLPILRWHSLWTAPSSIHASGADHKCSKSLKSESANKVKSPKSTGAWHYWQQLWPIQAYG